LARACPCPCSVGSREMTISELNADSLEDFHAAAKQQVSDKLVHFNFYFVKKRQFSHTGQRA